MSNLAEQHALVTGGGSGIGAAIAASLAEIGVTVTLLGRNVERLALKAAELGVSHQVADVTQRRQLGKAFSAAEQEHGAITILINNAGEADAIAFAKMDDDHWDRMLAVNLSGVYNCTKAAIGPMLAAGYGRVINIASTAALTGYAYVSAYCAAKHGVLGLTRALALEYARQGITVNAVCPGYTDTDIVRQAINNIVASTGRSEDEALNELVRGNPQGRLIHPEEVAETVLWLCGQNSITGQAIAVAGGETM